MNVALGFHPTVIHSVIYQIVTEHPSMLGALTVPWQQLAHSGEAFPSLDTSQDSSTTEGLSSQITK